MNVVFWGMKDVAFLDIWSEIHILSGIAIGYLLLNLYKNSKFEKKKAIIITALVIAYGWEMLEYFLESGLFGKVIANWFYAVEFLPNRIFIDPAMFLVGSLIALKKPTLAIPATFITVAWLLLHIFIFPHAEYIQSLLI